MGNAAWGKGYYQGLGEGRQQGTTGALLVGGVIIVGKWGYEEIQKRRLAKREQQKLANSQPSSSGEDGASESDGDA